MPPVRIREWLREKVADPHHRGLLWWVDEQKGILAIHWKHASFEDYDDEKDSVLFKMWAQENNRYDPDADDTAEERKRWKTNFRCALNSATNIKKGEQTAKIDKRQAYRLFELLDRPDPIKVQQKQQSNKLAAKSKQKPVSQKRVYKSRLNKSAAYVKREPKEQYQSREESQFQKKCLARQSRLQKSTVKEELPMDTFFGDLSRPADVQSYDESVPVKSECDDGLPAMLDEYHEDEKDGGYCSASDSSSVNSPDLTTGRLSPNQDFLTEHSLIPPVETMLRDRVYGVTPLPMTVNYNFQLPSYNFPSEGYISHDNQVLDELNTPNVRTEMIMQQDDNIIPMSVRETTEDDGRSYMLL